MVDNSFRINKFFIFKNSRKLRRKYAFGKLTRSYNLKHVKHSLVVDYSFPVKKGFIFKNTRKLRRKYAFGELTRSYNLEKRFFFFTF
jgi:hypothetical protein